MASAGTKRPFVASSTSPSRPSQHRSSGHAHDHGNSNGHGEGGKSEDGGKRSKPKDWRDAFLDEDEPRRRRSRSRSRSKDRDRRYRREYQDRDRERRHESSRGLDYREDNRDRDRDYRERDRARGQSRDTGRRDRGERGQGHYDREQRERGESRRYGDTRDQRRDQDRDYGYDRERDRKQSRDDSKRSGGSEREEGEIEPSPDKKSAALPSDASPARSHGSPQKSDVVNRDPPRGFQAIAIPTGPRARGLIRPSHLGPAGNALDKPDVLAIVEEEEPVIVIEEEKDPEQLLEERRKKREAIMAKFKAQGRKEQPVKAELGTVAELVGTGTDSVNSAGIRTGANTTTTGATPLLKQLGTRSTSILPGSANTPINIHEPSLAPTPLGHDFDLTKQADTAGDAVIPDETKDEAVGADMMISAADYDPSKEGMVDREKRMKDMDHVKVEAGDVADGVGEPILVDESAEQWEEVEIEVDDEDDEVDMFDVFAGEEREKKKKKVTVRRLKGAAKGEGKQQIVAKPKVKMAAASALGVVDNVDDTDGYYRITPGEILDNGRYEVTINLGKGMFSAVVKAKVLKAVDQERRQDVVGKEVAIKVIRSQESMYVAGRKEVGILKKLNDADPEDKKHIVRMDRTFEHRGHLCIVTESLSMNLRDVIKRFGKDVGLNMRAVRAYAHQMFLALSLTRKCGVVHADIKPDNILVSENKATLKVCDLGSASDVAEGEITPYLVSRFYRAPEIILGLPYDTSIDIWSVGCTLYELYTGKILFPGRSNNHMLLLMMEVKGKFNHRLIKKATLGEMHFDENMNFVSIEKDKITLQDVAKTLVINKPTRDLRSRLLPASSVQVKMKEDELKQLQNFVDLLEKCLQLDPIRRLSPRDALLHPFLAA